MSLRTKVLRGGIYISLRQGLGVVINLGGVLLLTRTIGPENYGLYAGALSVFTFLQLLSLLGIDVYLLRREGEEREEVYHQAFTLWLLLGGAGMSLALLGLPLLERWVRSTSFGPTAMVLFLGLPVTLMTQVPLARLGRALDYKRIALVELVGLSAYYVAALALAFVGFGVAAPLAGWWVQQVILLVLLFYAARYYPRLHWDSTLIKEMVGYGFGFSASLWIWQLRD